MNYMADIEQSNIETTVSEEEFCGKLRAWRESTSTSPSGLHFGHYKAGIARHKYASIPNEDEDYRKNRKRLNNMNNRNSWIYIPPSC
jgi:hypothetical protein